MAAGDFVICEIVRSCDLVVDANEALFSGSDRFSNSNTGHIEHVRKCCYQRVILAGLTIRNVKDDTVVVLGLVGMFAGAALEVAQVSWHEHDY